jgi:eukaryotic-like serine/threonine-protein kinase
MCYRVPDRYVQTGEKLSGGMGDVLICTDTYLDRPVAIKFIQNVQDENRLVDELFTRSIFEDFISTSFRN